MQALQNLMTTIRAQMSGLTTQAKLLIGSLMVILVMTLFLVAQYAGKTSMVPLAVSHLGDDGRARVVAWLGDRGIPHEDSASGGIMVPSERSAEIVAQLYNNGDIIEADQIDFNSLIGQESPFISREQNRQRWLNATMNVLGRMIGQMDGIRQARVIIATPDRTPGIGGADVRPSATVYVNTAGNGLAKTKVDAIANAVARSHARLVATNVAVVDEAGKYYRARSDEDFEATGHLDVQREHENYLRRKIEDHLRYIRGVHVAVNAMVDTTRRESRQESFEDPKVGPIEESSRTLSTTNQRSSGTPGVRVNTGVAVNNSGTTSNHSDESSDALTIPMFPRGVSTEKDAGGYARKINASIGIPRSYFLAQFRVSAGDPEAAPTEAELQPLVTTETARIEEDIKLLIDTDGNEAAIDGSVRVSLIADIDEIYGNGEPGSASGLADASGGMLAGGTESIVKYASLGGLAMISLLMMFMMVRKASVREELPTAEDLVGIPPALSDDESDLVGEAEESEPVLEGMEVDEASIQRQQMLEQVSNLIIQAPDEAAGLVRKWLRDDI